jgi:hypothetical protein
MQKMLALFIGSAALFFLAATVFQSPSEARRGGFRGGGGHAFGHARAGSGFRAGTFRGNRNFAAHRVRNVNRNVARRVNRNVRRDVRRNVNRRYVYRNGRWGYWRNGAWIVAPAAIGAGYVASCAYEYNRWRSTGSSYWRDRYYRCAG